MNYYLSSILAFAGMVVQLFILYLVLVKVGDCSKGSSGEPLETCEPHGHH